jgi:dTDP-4-dehydrorhamnose reductase
VPNDSKPPKILVFGRAGQVATELARPGPSVGAVICLGRPEGDITDPAAIEAALTAIGPDVVVNAAAFTAVDRAEIEPEAAFAVNRDGPLHLARACARSRLPLVHISTDYVFDGAKRGPYVEDDPVGPLGVYGASKLAGEAAIRSVLEHHVILRTAWVYSPFGHNFMKTMIRLGRERDNLRVVDDQIGSPTAARSVAEAILRIADNLVRRPTDGFGTYHWVDRGATTWHGFAEAIFALIAARGGKAPVVEAIPTALYPTPARRPQNSVLNCERIERVHGLIARPWKEVLAESIDAYLATEAAPPRA